METMKPRCVWIEGICYRKNAINPIFQKNAESDSKSSAYYREKGNSKNKPTDVWEEEENYDCHLPEENLDIKKLADNRYQLNLPVPSVFFGNIIGAKGTTKKRLETETRTKINIPRDQGDIVITGPDSRSLESVKTRIDVILDSARQRMPLTHFLSIPLNYPCLQVGFLEFKDEITRHCDGCRGMDESIFQTAEKLHLTIGTLVLLDDNEREKAAAILLECKQEIIQPIMDSSPHFDITIEGIEYMNDDPAEVDVLYAKVQTTDGSNKLQQLADRLLEKFVASGLMQKQYDRVKIHLTIMNTRYRTEKTVANETELGPKDKKTRITFDARKILKDYENFHFGTVEIRSIQISQLHSTGSDGFYKATATLEVP